MSAPVAMAGDTVVLRPVTAAHVPEIMAVVTHPEIAAWWGGYDLERVRRELGEKLRAVLHPKVGV